MSEMNEATLESRLHAVLTKVFPWISPGEIKHQVVFSVNLGRNTFKVDGSAASELAHPRLDILLMYKNKNLAVLELKAPSKKLTENDEKQGKSYARLLDDIAPLTIVTNGCDIRIINTYTGESLGDGVSESALEQTMKTACAIASKEVSEAVLCILNGNIMAWKEVISELTQQNFEETISIKEYEGLFFKRNMAEEILKDINDVDTKLILLDGDALTGKTMLLYGIFMNQINDDSYYMFYIPSDGLSIFESLSRLISSHIGVAISDIEAERLLSKHSYSSGERLVIVYDDMTPESKQNIKDITIITNYHPARFGNGVCIVASFNSVYRQSLTIKQNGRDSTVLKRRANKEYHLGILDDQEFAQACSALAQHKIGFIRGAEYNTIYREPGMLNMLASYVHKNRNCDDKAAFFAPIVNESLFSFSEDIYDPGMRLSLRKIVKKMIADFTSCNLPPAELHIFSLRYFSILEKSLNEAISVKEIERLESSGYIKKIYANDYAFYIMPLQRLVASIFRDVVEDFIRDARDDHDKIYNFLIFVCSNIRFGEIIAASALYNTKRNTDLFHIILNMLYKSKPHKDDFEISDNARMVMDFKGQLIEIDKKFLENFLQGAKSTYSKVELMPWLILSHLFFMEKIYHIHALIEVASFEGILVSPELMLNKPLHTHSSPGGDEFLCLHSGMIEVITYALFANIVDFNDEELVQFCGAIEEKGSLFSLNRFHTALMAAEGSSDVNSELIASRASRIKRLIADLYANQAC